MAKLKKKNNANEAPAWLNHLQLYACLMFLPTTTVKPLQGLGLNLFGK